MFSFTITFTDQHAHTVQFTAVLAYNKHTALWLVCSNQICMSQVEATLTSGDTLTVTVTQP